MHPYHQDQTIIAEFNPLCVSSLSSSVSLSDVSSADVVSTGAFDEGSSESESCIDFFDSIKLRKGKKNPISYNNP